MSETNIKYNLIEYLKTEHPTIEFVMDGWETNSPNTAIAVIGSGGTPDHYVDREDFTFQLISRSNDKTIADTNANNVYRTLRNRFNLLLPEVTIDATIYLEVDTRRIVPIQTPGYIGCDDEGRHEYSANFIITPNYYNGGC